MDRWEHKVTARNTATESENRIHADDTARAYGFAGGLVPGVTVYGYMTRPALDAYGPAWLTRGSMSARFGTPVYDGDVVTARAVADGDELALELVDGRGDVCATGRAGLPASTTPPDLNGFPLVTAPAPSVRADASPATFAVWPVLGEYSFGFHAERAGEFLAEIGDDAPAYRELRVAHPGWLIRTANYVLTGTIRLGPWIHVSSAVQHHQLVHDNSTVSTRARVVEVFERKGHRFVDLDVVWVVGDAVAMSARHTAIYEPRRLDTVA